MPRPSIQRLPSPSFGFSSLIHFAGLSSFAASFKFLVDSPSPINVSYGWHFQYLTIIGLSLAVATFAFGSMADITHSARLFRLKNVLSICITPLEVLISLLYWSIRSIDKSLVVPPWAQLGLIPDLGFHLIPSILLTTDFLLLSPPWTITFPRALLLSSAIAFSYWFWVEQCHRHNGWYPYPLFEHLTPAWRVGLFCLCATLMAVSTAALKALHAAVNGSAEREKLELRRKAPAGA